MSLRILSHDNTSMVLLRAGYLCIHNYIITSTYHSKTYFIDSERDVSDSLND